MDSVWRTFIFPLPKVSLYEGRRLILLELSKELLLDFWPRSLDTTISLLVALKRTLIGEVEECGEGWSRISEARMG